jgi:predicted RNase H-like HicB family nuclease
MGEIAKLVDPTAEPYDGDILTAYDLHCDSKVVVEQVRKTLGNKPVSEKLRPNEAPPRVWRNKYNKSLLDQTAEESAAGWEDEKASTMAKWSPASNVYVAKAPRSGVMSQGRTLTEALESLIDALELTAKHRPDNAPPLKLSDALVAQEYQKGWDAGVEASAFLVKQLGADPKLIERLVKDILKLVGQ